MQLKRAIVPGPKVESEIVKTTTDFHNGVTKAGFPQANFVFDDARPLDTADGMFHPDAQRSQPVIDGFIEVRERLAFGFFLRLQDGNTLDGKALKATILSQVAPCG